MLSAASERANREAQSRTASILQDFQRRGQLGSGMQLAAQQDAAAEAMARQARESQLAAAEGYRNRLLATDKSAALGGDIRASEMSEEARNVGILNSFNERTSKNYQDYLQMRADAANKARIMEVERARKVSDANIANRNEAARQNRQMYNQGQMTQYDVARQNRSNRLDLEERKNKVKQAMYDNLMSRARGKAGVAETRMNFENQNVRDTNQMIRGLGDAATAGAMYYGKYGQAAQEGQSQEGASSGGYVRPGYDDREANFYE
jgi:hypothetical protein